MRFDFEDTEEVVEKTRNLKSHLREDPYEDYVYKAYVESTGSSVLEALTDVECRLTVLQEDEDGGLSEIMLFPVLPLQFDIRLRRTGNIVNRFQKYALHLDSDDLRARVSGSSYARSPVDAFRDLREKDLVLYLEEECGEDEYELLIRGTGTETAVESSRLETRASGF